MHWFYSAVLGFGPTLLVTCFGINALRRGDNRMLAFASISTLLGWLMPGLVFCAGNALSAGKNPPDGITAAGWLVLQMLAFHLATHIISRYAWERSEGSIPLSLKHNLGWLLRDLSQVVGVGSYFMVGALLDPDFFLARPTLGHFVGIYFAAYIAGTAINAVIPRSGKCQLLPPCELNSRIQQIAAECDTEVDAVYIFRRLPYRFANAYAWSSSTIILSEDLVRCLSKEEVDAVVAHELGHTGDKSLWDVGQASLIIGALAWLALMGGAEWGINRLPDSLQSLHYVKWFLLFLVPPLAMRAHSRWRERRAERNVRRLADPRAALSGDFRLHALGENPFEYPWWYALLSTHPSPTEQTAALAAVHGLSEADVSEIRDRVAADPEGKKLEHYELPEDDGVEDKLVTRPNQSRLHRLKTISCVVAGVVIVFVGGGFALIQEESVWILAGVPVGILVMLVPTLIIEMAAAKKTRRAVAEALAKTYPDEPLDDMLLMDVIFADDWDEQTWQGARISAKDGRLIALGEARRLEVLLACPVQLNCWYDTHSFNSSTTALAIHYEVDGVPQWLVMKPLGRPERGLPRSYRQMEYHLRAMLTAAGAKLEPKKKTRQLVGLTVIRSILGLAAIAGTVGLVEIVIRLSEVGSGESFWPHAIAVWIVWPFLWAWVARARGSKQEISPADEE